jgi:hypothetical protein
MYVPSRGRDPRAAGSRLSHGTRRPLGPPFSPVFTTTPMAKPFCGRGFPYGNPQTPVPDIPSATKPSKPETNHAMGLLGQPTAPKHILKPGEDTFDPLEWTSAFDLPSAVSPDHSPEPVPIKPKPVAYTTVGSVVNPNVVPQFTAPNRIQREGANRRPLHQLLGPPRQYEPLTQPRTQPAQPLPSLNMASSMLYTQQIARSPNRVTPSSSSTASTTCRSPLLTISNMPGPLAKHEELALMRNLLLHELQDSSANATDSTGSPTVSKKHTSSVTLPTRGIYTVKELIDEHNRSNSVPSSVQGLEKMQTLQRLAKFDNPMQELARTRLAEFSLLKSQSGSTSPSCSFQEMLPQNQIGLSKMSTTTSNAGELDLGYRFPPPGLGLPSTSRSGSSRAHSTAPSARPGYPEPLTAGPPGQRQFPSQPYASHGELWGLEYGSQPNNSYADGTTVSPWGNGNGYSYHPPAQPAFFQAHSGHVNSKIVDTLDPAAAAKYYPQGFPADMTGYYQPMSEETARFMEGGPTSLLPKAVKDARRDAATENLIFEGGRRYGQMGADDYYTELLDLKSYNDVKKENPFGAIGPPKKKQFPTVETKPITDEEIKKKPVSELIGPILESSWGTLASYRSTDCPGSYNQLSKFTTSPDCHIDAEEEGNKSYFGEDWGKPVKKSAVDASAGWDE